jgi:hypothetical protein
MTETEKLTVLRQKLISKRRSLVESLRKTPDQQLTGDSLARIQAGIDAVDRAIEDERRAEAAIQAPRRTAALSGDK